MAIKGEPARILVDVVIPAIDEERSIGRVLDDLPFERLREVVVVDNGSTDRTVAVAKKHGATVIHEPRRGYGSACLAGLAHLRAKAAPPTIVVFLDGDYSDHPDELPLLIDPIIEDRADLVIGSRMLGDNPRDALLPHSRFGNWLAGMMIRTLFGVPMTDLGPFRAIDWKRLEELEMEDVDYGWTVEMQAKAAQRGLRYLEVPASYRKRIGESKITGTLRGSVKASVKIVYTMLKLRQASSLSSFKS